MSSRSNEKNRETQGDRDIGSDTPTPEPETSCLIGTDEDDSQLLERLCHSLFVRGNKADAYS